MSEHVHLHASPSGTVALTLPFAFDDFVAAAGEARRAFLRRVPNAFTRDEWAYLLTSLDPDRLAAQVAAVFGPRASTHAIPQWIVRPRGSVAIWLPGNVSLLGPLTLLAVAASGNAIRLKGSSRATNLTGAFLDVVRAEAPSFASFFDQVSLAVFDRDDPRNAEMAADADVRIVFGSDAAAEQVHRLPHPLGSTAVSFLDRRSEAWIEPAAVNDAVVRALVSVFAVYGQAGCTSPSVVRLIGATVGEARAFRARLLEAWPAAVRRDVPQHLASEATRLLQWSRAVGWDAEIAHRHKAIVAVGDVGLPRQEKGMALWITPCSANDALAALPGNIQTIGHAVCAGADAVWHQLVARTPVRRWVPLRAMHHFGWVWDGEEFWRHLFRFTEWAS